MADRDASRAGPQKVSAAAGAAPSLHIDSLRLRVAGRDAADGRRLATDLAAALAAQRGALFGAGKGSVHVGGLRLSVRAPNGGGGSTDQAGAIAGAVARAVASARGGQRRGR